MQRLAAEILVNAYEREKNKKKYEQKIDITTIHYISILYFGEYCFSGVEKNF